MTWGTFCFVAAALAAPSSFAQTTPKDLKRYIDFAVEWTPYSYHDEALPKIQVEKHAIVQILAHGDLETAQAEAKGETLPSVNAIYVPEDKKIYVSDHVSLANPKIEVTLVHEIVHYLQDITGYTRSLNGHIACTESEAYDVQMLWQKINNVDVDDIPFVYQQALIASTKCMGNKASAISSSFKSRPEDEPHILTRR